MAGMRNALLTLALVAGASANAGCGLISADFEGTVRILAQISGDDGQRTFESLEVVDPNSNEDYKNNKDKIQEGEITAIDVKITRVTPRNNATVVVGQVDVRKTGAEDWVQGVAEWEGVPVEQDNVFRLTLSPERQAELNKIVFEDEGSIDMNIVGVADQEPVEFDVEITLLMRFVAGF